ncbi:MAG: sulfurtransferase TusA family protein [Clostridium sp.]|uniref:sulfurtransferase TusA family protein n=1 Tax=Clostridium sp. TaxID=1506 RepID=UPI00303CBAE2
MFLLVKIDARGMSCPQPVLMAKKALGENKDGFEILVDNNVAKENVSRFIKNVGFKVIVKEVGEDFSVEAKK